MGKYQISFTVCVLAKLCTPKKLLYLVICKSVASGFELNVDYKLNKYWNVRDAKPSLNGQELVKVP